MNKEKQYETRVSKGANKTVQIHIGGSLETQLFVTVTKKLHSTAAMGSESVQRGNRNGTSSSGESMKTCNARILFEEQVPVGPNLVHKGVRNQRPK